MTEPVSRARALLVAGGLFAVVLIGAEFSFRALGYEPYRSRALTMSPRSFADLDPVFGYRLRPGTYTITLDQGFSFTATHDDRNSRITKPLEAYPDDSTRPQLRVFGCSFTYGWGLSDEDTFPWQLQNRLTGYDVLNHGMGGTGILHSLLNLRTEMERGLPPPGGVVVAYASFHDTRHLLSRAWRKSMGVEEGDPLFPTAGVAGDGLIIRRAPIRYEPWPFQRRSALVHGLEALYDAATEDPERGQRVSRAIVKELQALSRSAGFSFVLAGITGDSRTRALLEDSRRAGIRVVDVSVDLSDPRYTLPDGHPSAEAQRQYAQTLAGFLEQGPWRTSGR